MLKKRIVAVLVVKDGLVVQSIGFRRYLPVGKPAIAVEFLNQWGIDEIILLDILATLGSRAPDFATVREAARRCRVPLTVGGGITSLDHIHELMHCGADKVAFNQAALHQTALLTDAARVFGDQCVVASIDACATNAGHQVYDYRQREILPLTPWDHAKHMQEAGAGEILINSVDRDGIKCGFDLDLIHRTCTAVTIPVIACGGAGSPAHFLDVLEKTETSAIAAANFFHFFEHSVTITKALANQQHPVRHETHARYRDNRIDEMGRLFKKDDKTLEELLYLKIEKEVI
jgi:cyclase